MTIPYPTLIILLLLSSFAGAKFIRNVKLEPWQTVKYVTLIAFLVYFVLSYYKLTAMLYGLWDFGIYDSMMHNLATGRGFMLDFRGHYDHFSPTVLVLVPFYYLYDSPVWLILFQAAVMTLAAPVLYLTARRYFKDGTVPALLSIMYLLNPYFSKIVLYDFHIECLFPLGYFTAFYFYSRHKIKTAALILALLPLIKEDFTVPVIATGFFFLFSKPTRKAGVAVMAAGFFWIFFTLKVWFPLIIQMEYWHYGRYAVIGNNAGETLNNFYAILSRVLTANAFKVMISTLLPFALLPFFHWRSLLLLWAPTIGIQLISTSGHQAYLMSHYASAVIAVTPVAALFGARHLQMLYHSGKLRRLPQAGYMIRFAFIFMIVNHIVLCDLPLHRYNDYIGNIRLNNQFGLLSIPFNYKHYPAMFNAMTHAQFFEGFTDNLPIRPEHRIVAQNELGNAFLRRAKVYNLTTSNGDMNGRLPPDAGEPEFYIFDQKNYYRFEPEDDINNIIRQVIASEHYTLFNQNGVIIFVKNNLIKP